MEQPREIICFLSHLVSPDYSFSDASLIVIEKALSHLLGLAPDPADVHPASAFLLLSSSSSHKDVSDPFAKKWQVVFAWPLQVKGEAEISQQREKLLEGNPLHSLPIRQEIRRSSMRHFFEVGYIVMNFCFGCSTLATCGFSPVPDWHFEPMLYILTRVVTNNP